MAITDDIQAKLVTIAKDIVAERADVQAKFAAINAQVTSLQAQVKAVQDQLASGTLVSAADLKAVSDTLDLIDANVKTISEPIPPGT